MHFKPLCFSLVAASLSISVAFAADCFSNCNPKVSSVDFQTAQDSILNPTFPDEFDSLFLDNHAPLILTTAGSAKICVRNENFDELSRVEFAEADVLGGIASIYSQCFDGAGESAGGTFHVNGNGGQVVVYVMSSQFGCFNGQEFPSL